MRSPSGPSVAVQPGVLLVPGACKIAARVGATLTTWTGGGGGSPGSMKPTNAAADAATPIRRQSQSLRTKRLVSAGTVCAGVLASRLDGAPGFPASIA